MKKLFTKIVGVSLGIAMAIGVGVGAANSNRAATRLSADNDILVSENAAGTSYTGTNFDVSAGGATASGYYKLGSSTLTSKSSYNIDGDKNISYSITTRKFGGPSNAEAVVNLSLLNGSTTVATASYSPSSTSLTAYNGTFTVTGDTSDVKFVIKGNGTSGGGKGVGISAISFTATSAGGSGGGDPDPTTYSVTYNENGAVSGTVPTDATDYDNGASVTVLGNTGSLTKAGYIWAGWNTKADGTGTSYATGSAFNISKDTTLYARWLTDHTNDNDIVITADFLNLTTGITSAATLTADDGVQYSAAPGGANSVKATAINDSSSNKFNSDSPILMGKNGAYIYNNDAFQKNIYKIEVFANYGASTSVAVAVAFGANSPCSSSYETDAQTLNPYNAVYTFNPSISNAKYFRIQVTNAANAQVQIKVYFVIPTTSVTVSPASVTLNPNDTQQLTATVLPANTTDSLSYSTSNSNIATVSNSGLITAKAVGLVTITATSGAQTGTCVVTVELPADPFITPASNEISGYTDQDTTVNFIYGNLTGVLGISTNNSNVSAAIQNNDGAGNAQVAVSFDHAGSAEIYLKDGSTTRATIAVTITASTVTITGLPSSSTAYVGKTLNLGSSITVTAVGACSDDVTWESENDAIAEVSSTGVVTGVATGTVDITVTSDDYPSATMTCEITVVVDTRWDTEFSNTMVADIVLPPSGDTAEKYYVVAQITAITNSTYGNGNAVDEDGTEFTIYGMYNYNGTVRYDSMVSEEKPVVGDFVVLYGVFCEYKSAPEIKSARVVQRNGAVFQDEPLTGVSLDKTTLLLGVGDDYELEASPVPNNASLGDVTWTSSNDGIASVSNGTVTGVAVGSATITATAGGFTATCNVTVSLKGAMAYTANSTTNMTASGNASTVGLNSSLFSVDAAKGDSANFPGLNKDQDIRLYAASGNGNSITVSMDDVYTITSIKIDYKQGASNATIYVGANDVDGDDGVYSINNSSFIIKNTGSSDQIRINSVDIFYRAATAAEQASRLDTASALRFNYTKIDDTLTFNGAAIRFGGFISDDLWDALNSESTIQGYGVLIAETSYLTDHSTTLKGEYAAALAIAGNVDDALELMCGENNGDEAIRRYTANGASPAAANAEQKAFMGVSAGDTYYTWTVRINFGSKFTTHYSAVAFIRTANGLVFLEETSVSAKELATAVLPSIDSELPVHEPIQYISERP